MHSGIVPYEHDYARAPVTIDSQRHNGIAACESSNPAEFGQRAYRRSIDLRHDIPSL